MKEAGEDRVLGFVLAPTCVYVPVYAYVSTHVYVYVYVYVCAVAWTRVCV